MSIGLTLGAWPTSFTVSPGSTDTLLWYGFPTLQVVSESSVPVEVAIDVAGDTPLELSFSPQEFTLPADIPGTWYHIIGGPSNYLEGAPEAWITMTVAVPADLAPGSYPVMVRASIVPQPGQNVSMALEETITFTVE
jgi:hypothetical protein